MDHSSQKLYRVLCFRVLEPLDMISKRVTISDLWGNEFGLSAEEYFFLQSCTSFKTLEEHAKRYTYWCFFSVFHMYLMRLGKSLIRRPLGTFLWKLSLRSSYFPRTGKMKETHIRLARQLVNKGLLVSQKEMSQLMFGNILT